MTLSGILPGRVFDTSRDSHQGGTSKGVRRDCSLHDSFITHLKKAGYHHFRPLSRNITLSIIFSKAEKKHKGKKTWPGNFEHTHVILTSIEESHLKLHLSVQLSGFSLPGRVKDGNKIVRQTIANIEFNPAP